MELRDNTVSSPGITRTETHKEGQMTELWTRAELVKALRLKDHNSIANLECWGLPFVVLGNRKRYRPEAVDAFIRALEQAIKPDGN